MKIRVYQTAMITKWPRLRTVHRISHLNKSRHSSVMSARSKN